jgi:hypothetical protein
MSGIKRRIGTKNVVSLVEAKDAYCISIQSIIWILLQLQPDFNDNATVWYSNLSSFGFFNLTKIFADLAIVALEGLCSA